MIAPQPSSPSAAAAVLQIIQRLGLLSRKVQLPRYQPPLPPPAAAAAPAPAGFSAPPPQGFVPQNHSTSSNPFMQQQGFGAPPNGLSPMGSGSSAVLSPMPSYPPVNGGFMGPSPAAAATAAGSSSGVQQQQQGSDPLSNPMFVCPITQDVMKEPVIAADGYTYEKKAIQV